MSFRDERLNKYFTMGELTYSRTAEMFNLGNRPTPEAEANLRKGADVLFRIREYLGVPLHVTSGYRSLRVNKKVGGSRTSAHVHGSAFDLKADGHSSSELAHKLVAFFRSNTDVKFDQIILEYPERGSRSWVHLGFRWHSEPREQLLTISIKGTRKGLG